MCWGGVVTATGEDEEDEELTIKHETVSKTHDRKSIELSKSRERGGLTGSGSPERGQQDDNREHD